MRRRESLSRRGRKERSIELSSWEKGQDLFGHMGCLSVAEGEKRGPNGRGAGGVPSSSEKVRENARGKKKGTMERGQAGEGV
jgi:hypothetical protein